MCEATSTTYINRYAASIDTGIIAPGAPVQHDPGLVAALSPHDTGSGACEVMLVKAIYVN